MNHRIMILLSIFTIVSCAPIQAKKESERFVAEKAAHTNSEFAVADSSNVVASDINQEIAKSNPLMSETEESEPLQISEEINKRVEDWIQYFTVRERERTIRFFERGLALRPHIEKILRENDVPAELFYLAMIESGFVPNAKSHAKAVGVWQFMKGTAKNYGLAVNTNIDERRNWIKSTEAAASYLKDLNNVFGSWYLAMASYNAGEHRIVNSIMRGKTRDFWALAEAGRLPNETLNYVPKFLAAMIVGRNLQKYNIQVQPVEAWEDFEIVSVPSGISLKSLSSTTGISLEIIKKWNHDLIKGQTPFSKNKSAEIYLPKSQSSKIEENRLALESLPRAKISRSYASETDTTSLARGSKKKATGNSYAVYVVRRGDHLSSISKKLGLSTRTIKKINGLKRSRIHAGQRLRYPV